MGVLIADGQRAEVPPVLKPIRDEVHAPALIVPSEPRACPARLRE